MTLYDFQLFVLFVINSAALVQCGSPNLKSGGPGAFFLIASTYIVSTVIAAVLSRGAYYVIIGVLLIVVMSLVMDGPAQAFSRVGNHLYHDAIEWQEHFLLAGIVVLAYGLCKVFMQR